MNLREMRLLIYLVVLAAAARQPALYQMFVKPLALQRSDQKAGRRRSS